MGATQAKPPTDLATGSIQGVVSVGGFFVSVDAGAMNQALTTAQLTTLSTIAFAVCFAVTIWGWQSVALIWMQSAIRQIDRQPVAQPA